MDGTVTIGEFSRLTHLSAKALRHYHDVGLLIPERIDVSGYRRYGPGQVRPAQLIGRLRRLDMPVPDIKAVLAAPDEQRRDAAIAEHLQRMEDELGRTAQVVASLRALLGPQSAPLAVEYRTVPAIPVLAITDRVRHADITDWCARAYPELYAGLAASGAEPAGPGGATYDTGFFEEDLGEVTAFVPVAQAPVGRAPVGQAPVAQAPVARAPVGGPSPGGRAGPVAAGERCAYLTLPGGRFAVAQHAGSYTEIDRTYGNLGSHVATHDTAQPDPIREVYLIGPDRTPDPDQFRTEIWWPIASVPPAQPATSIEHQESPPWQ